MNKRIVFFLSILILLSLFAQANPSSPGNEYLKIEVAQERLNKTFLLVGRVFADYIILFDDKLNVVKISRQPQPQKPGLQESIKPIDAQSPSLTFNLNSSQISRCEQVRELKTFLEQLSIFEGHIEELEVTASSQKHSKCVSKISDHILKQGFRTSIAFGNLAEGGISIRGYLKGQKRQQTPTLNATQNFVVVEYASIRKIQAPINSEGLFVLSFDAPPSQLNLQFVFDHKTEAVAQINQLPEFHLGEDSNNFLGATYRRISKGYADSITLEKVPDAILQAALDEERQFQNKYRWSIRSSLRSRSVRGSGLIKEPLQLIVPLALEAKHIVTQQVAMHLEIVPDLKIGQDASIAPQTNYGSIGVSYALYGNEKRHFGQNSKLLWTAGAEGYYLMNRAKRASSNSVYLLTDLMGLALTNRVSYQATQNINIFVDYDLVPFPATLVNSFSLSNKKAAGLEYCTTFSNCLSMSIQKDDFTIRYLEQGALSFFIQDLTIGYRRSFE